MDGSTLSIIIIIPIVTTISLAAWLTLVAYAASHPEWKTQKPAPRHQSAGRETPPPGIATRGSDPLSPERSPAGRRACYSMNDQTPIPAPRRGPRKADASSNRPSTDSDSTAEAEPIKQTRPVDVTAGGPPSSTAHRSPVTPAGR
jgi:hypothetical protein